MKKLSLTIMLAFCTLVMVAQNSTKVSFQGASPDIVDFAWAFLFSDDDEDDCDQEATSGIKDALERYRQGKKQEDNVKLVVDRKGGFISYEWRYEENSMTIEMCYWNEADKKHKLFAYSSWYYANGKPSQGQYDTLAFMRYDNAKKTMTSCGTPGFEVTYDQNTTYSLPRVGKDITVNKWNKNGQKTQTTLKWNGHGFNK